MIANEATPPSPNFADLLESRGLSVRTAAKKFGLGSTQVHNLCTGKHGTTMTRATLIARRLDCSVGDVVAAIAESQARYARRQRRLKLARK